MNRLEAIVSLIKDCNVLADIGTDHGYVAEMALDKELCKNVIATDINKGPLDNAFNHLTKIGYQNLVSFRLGGGLEVLKENEADNIVIAGMGGELIAKILDDSKNVAKSADALILQPMTNIELLRKYLNDNDYIIEKEVIVKEMHHYYFIMRVIKGTQKIEDDIYFYISKYLLDKRDYLLLDYIKMKLDLNQKIINNLKNSTNDNSDKLEKLLITNKKLSRMVDLYEA